MEMLFMVSAVAMPIVMLILVWLMTGKFAWGALAAAALLGLIKFSEKKFGYGKTVLLGLAIFLAIFVGDKVRVEFLNDSRKKAVAQQEEIVTKKDLAEKEAKRLAEEERNQKKRNLVKEFALREAPSTWEALQALEVECKTVEAQVSELKKTLESFNKNAEDDNDYNAVKKKLAEMNQARGALWMAMERAYIQYCKFKASAGDAELSELRKSATAAAVKEASAAKERYSNMSQTK